MEPLCSIVLVNRDTHLVRVIGDIPLNNLTVRHGFPYIYRDLDNVLYQIEWYDAVTNTYLFATISGSTS